ncbi:MAG: hypothetical protein ABJO09_07160 [Hyphomicrobiales bacterium]
MKTLRKLSSYVAIVAITSALAAPVYAADFGRGESRMLDRQVLPLVGSFVARFRNEPVSHFNLTDDEKLLRRQAQHLIAPPHARDWFHQIAAKVQRYRISAPIDQYLSPDAYYAYLRSDRFRSTAGRYNRLSADMAADAALLHPFFSRAAHVLAGDKMRLRAVGAYDGRDPNPPVYQRPIIRQNRSLAAEAEARVYENKEIINWAERAVAFRIESYRRAISRLVIEEPTGRAGLADGELQRLEFMFEKARLAHLSPDAGGQEIRKSRYMRDRDESSFDPMPSFVPQK